MIDNLYSSREPAPCGSVLVDCGTIMPAAALEGDVTSEQ